MNCVASMEVNHIETLLEEVDQKESLRFLIRDNSTPPVGAVAIEILGYYGSVGHLVTEEIQHTAVRRNKLGGIFTSYMTEMVQLSSNEILLPVTILHLEIGNKPCIFTTTNFAIPDAIGYRLAEELYHFYQKHEVSKILLIDGVYNQSRSIDKRPCVHKITSTERQLEVTNESLTNGKSFTLCGQIASSFLTYWGNDIPVELFVVDTFAEYDPISSHTLLLYLADKWGFTGDFSSLEKKAQKFKTQYVSALDDRTHQTEANEIDSQYFI